MMGGERGTSEVVGFVLVFAVVLAGIGLVQTTGFDALAEARDDQRTAGSERAFLALAGPLDDVRRGAPGRTGSLRLGPGRLRVEAGPTVLVRANGSNRSYGTRVLGYRLGSTSLTYASGGVFRSDADGSVLLREPALSCRRGSTAASIASVVTIRPVGVQPDTDGSVTIVLRSAGATAARVDWVAIDLAGARHGDAWRRYLERAGWNERAPSVYSCDVARTYVRRTTVELRVVA